MSKSIPFLIATFIYAIFIIGTIGITAALLIALIYEVATHPADISTAGYVLLAFVAYSIWLCYKIIGQMKKKTAPESEIDNMQQSFKAEPLSKGLSRFISGFWVCLYVVTFNSIVASSIYFSSNWTMTLSTAELYQAEVVGVNETKLKPKNRHHNHGRGFIRISSSKKSYTPIVRFQSKEGSSLERELYFISGQTCEIGSKLPIYYSPLTDQAIYKSSLTYGIITAMILISFFLFMLSLAILSYALIGKVPDWARAFWNQIKMNLLYTVLFLGLVGITCFLGSLIYNWLFHDGYKHLPQIAIVFCFIIFFGCLLGGVGMICAVCGRKPASARKKKKQHRKNLR